MLEEPPPLPRPPLTHTLPCAHVNLWITLLFIVFFNIPRKRSNLQSAPKAIHYLCPLEVEEVALHHLIFTVNSAPVLEVGGNELIRQNTRNKREVAPQGLVFCLVSCWWQSAQSIGFH